MATVSLSHPMSLKEIEETLHQTLGPEYRMRQKGSRLDVIKDDLRGCMLRLRGKPPSTEVVLTPFIPSLPLGILISLISVSVAAAVMAYVHPLLGLLLLPVTLFLRLGPAQKVVGEVMNLLRFR